VILLGDVPQLPLQPGVRFKDFTLERYKTTGDFRFLLTMHPDFETEISRQATELSIRAATEDWHCVDGEAKSCFPSTIQHAHLAPYFLRTELGAAQPYLDIVDPVLFTLAYADATQLGLHGVDRVEQLFRRTIFKQPVCDSGD
jgi:hypothetical protein